MPDGGCMPCSEGPLVKDIDWEGLVGMWIMMSAKYNGRVLFLLVICKYYL